MLPCQVPRKSISQSWWTGSNNGATMLGSQKVNISVMVDVKPQWYYHARFLGSQYVHHGGRGVPMVLPFQVPRNSRSPSWWTGSPSGATMLGSQEVNVSIMVDGELHWFYHARFLGSQYLRHARRGVTLVLPCQVPRKSISPSWWTRRPIGATMIGSQEVNVYVRVDGEPHWCYHAGFLGSQYLCHGGRGVTLVLPCQLPRKSISPSLWTGSPIGAIMLGSQEVNTSVMVDEEPQWCHHARVIGSQYICHVGLGVPVVLPCQVPRKSISPSWWTGSTNGATMIGSQEVIVSIRVDGEPQWCYHARFLGSQYLSHGGREPYWCYHARFLGSQYLRHGGRGVTLVLACQVPRKSISPSWWRGSPIDATMIGSQEVNISVMVDGE